MPVSREGARELDRRAIEEWGIPSIVLMENAGRACADVVQRLAAECDGRPVHVLCGPGNNGGDGFVIARTCRNRGLSVRLWFAAEAAVLETLSSDTRTNAYLWNEMGGETRELLNEEQLARLAAELPESAVIVDALFGTGLTRPLEGHYADVVRAVGASDARVVAVDIPSGLDADTGEVLGAAVSATETVTFIDAKHGFFAGEGPRLCGRVTVAEIGVPTAWLDD